MQGAVSFPLASGRRHSLQSPDMLINGLRWPHLRHPWYNGEHWCVSLLSAGVAEPIKAGVEAGVRLGLGKQREDDKYTDADSITRKKLEVEIQADEDPERMKRREVQTNIRAGHLWDANILQLPASQQFMERDSSVFSAVSAIVCIL